MPRYFLNLRDRGTLIEDPEGDEAKDLAGVARIAQATIDDVFARPEIYGEPHRWTGCVFDITNEAGETVLTIPFGDERSETRKKVS